MIRREVSAVATLILLASSTASVIAASLPEKGALLFADDFERRIDDGEWTIKDKYAAAFVIEDGVLIGRELPGAGHGSTTRARIADPDFVMEFDFAFHGGRQFNLVLDDLNCKEVHAGHIARVVFNRRGITVQDDKTGVMNLKIRAARLKNPNWKAQHKNFLESKKRFVSHEFKVGVTYHAVIKKWNDVLYCQVGDTAVQLQSEGIAHPALTQFGPTITGGKIHFDNFKLWAAKAGGSNVAP